MLRFVRLTLIFCLAMSTPLLAKFPFENELRLIERDAAHAALLMQENPNASIEFVRAIHVDLQHRFAAIERKRGSLSGTSAIARRLQNTANELTYLEQQLDAMSPRTAEAPVAAVADAAGAFSGLVVSENLAPLANVTVRAFNQSGMFVRSGVTDASGNYRITPLAAGTYTVRTSNTLGYIDQTYVSPAVLLKRTVDLP